MKYRCLSDNELKELEEEFKHFLITNSIHTEEWEELNATKSPRVIQLVEIFSDIVLDKALKNIKFLEHTSKTDIMCFKCNQENMTLIGISSKNKEIDFTKDTLADFANDLDIFKTEKDYNKSREIEVFSLLESGCSIIDEERFKKIELAYTLSSKENKN